MKLGFIAVLAGIAAMTSGCATQQVEACCGKPEIVYVDKPVAECTRSVQRVMQVSPCAACERFPVTARLSNDCAR